MRILIVEDERNLRDLLAKRLSESGYSVDACDNGADAESYLDAAPYDAVLLDIMMPKLDGLTLLGRIRQKQNLTPVMLLTARDSLEDRVKGLDQGADDYLIKPFAFEELLARLRVLTRRQYQQAVNLLQLADLTLDPVSRAVKRNGREIDLSTREFAILEYLLKNQGVVLSRRQIEEHVWNFDYEVSSNVIDVYIRYLRKKIDDGFASKLIHTVRGFGYVAREAV